MVNNKQSNLKKQPLINVSFCFVKLVILVGKINKPLVISRKLTDFFWILCYLQNLKKKYFSLRICCCTWGFQSKYVETTEIDREQVCNVDKVLS